MIEIHEFYVVKSASGSLPALCGRCATNDGIRVSHEQAAVLARVPVRAIYRWVESDRVHCSAGSNGSLLVCVKSLPITGDQSKEVYSHQCEDPGLKPRAFTR